MRYIDIPIEQKIVLPEPDRALTSYASGHAGEHENHGNHDGWENSNHGNTGDRYGHNEPSAIREPGTMGIIEASLVVGASLLRRR